MRISLILGLSADGCLSLNQRDDLSWLSKEDKAKFREITTESGAVLMGKNTYLSLVNFGVFPLPGRRNFVLTHQQIDDRGGIFLAGTPEEVIKQISTLGVTSLSLIGGRSVYQDFLDSGLVDEIWLTQSLKTLSGEVKFNVTPHLKNFKLISEQALNSYEILKHFTKVSSA
jgi:dihydrofolate reductase